MVNKSISTFSLKYSTTSNISNACINTLTFWLFWGINIEVLKILLKLHREGFSLIQESKITIGDMIIPLWAPRLEAPDKRAEKIRELASFFNAFITGLPDVNGNAMTIVESIFSQSDLEEGAILRIHLPDTIAEKLQISELIFNLDSDDPTKVYVETFVPKLQLANI